MAADSYTLSRSALALMVLGALGTPAIAQQGRDWVDPPGETEAPETVAPRISPDQPAPAPPPPQVRPNPTPPPRGSTRARDVNDIQRIRRTAALEFTVHYLRTWSAPNDEALRATAAFYAPQVLFHGRTVSTRTLFAEKQRFAQRWPERNYRARENAMNVSCNASADICTVHTVFDFMAADPVRGQRSGGTGALQLIVQFAGDRPFIVAEHSAVLGRGGSSEGAER